MGNGREELYDFWSDPDELHDLAATSDKAAELERLRRLSAGQHGGQPNGDDGSTQ
jgi:arylsulfatase A-like enzyme